MISLKIKNLSYIKVEAGLEHPSMERNKLYLSVSGVKDIPGQVPCAEPGAPW